MTADQVLVSTFFEVKSYRARVSLYSQQTQVSMPADLKPIFESARELLKPYAKYFSIGADNETSYSLSSTKQIETLSKVYDGMFFASAKINKGAVGFYFMPIYTHESEFADLTPELRKLLKGKSCFHIKKEDPVIEQQLTDLLKKGFEVYKKAGWV
jgi:hypothetical protein